MEFIKNLWRERKTRLFILFAIIGLFIFIVQGYVDFGKSTAPQKKRKPAVESNVFDTQTIEEVDKEQTIDLYAQMKKEMASRESDLRDEKKRMNKDVEKLSDQVASQNAAMQALQRQLEILAQGGQIGQQTGAANPRVSRASETGMSVPNQAAYPPRDPRRVTVENPQTQILTRARGPETKGVIRTITQTKVTQISETGQIKESDLRVVYVEDKNGKKKPVPKGDKKAVNPEITAKKKAMIKEQAKTFIPAGSIISGVMLNGVDAPTALSKNASPLPVTIRVKLDVLMPNNYNADLQDCFVTGSVTGDLASERAYIRSISLSCINEKGEALETGMNGYAVSDFDGRNGVRGTVVSRAGSALLATFGASFLSGIANATKPQAITAVNTEPGDNTQFQTPDMGNVGASATLGGISGGSDRLAQYAIAIADQQWPVIEVSPGTPITFFLEKGMSLPVAD